MPIRLHELIAKVPPEIEGRVRLARDQSRPAIQEAMRAECRLVMRTAAEAESNLAGAQVPIELAPGHPAVLGGIVFPDDLAHVMVLSRYRAAIEQAQSGAAGLIHLRRELAGKPEPDKWILATESELKSILDWAVFLAERLHALDPLKDVLAVREDFLGVYSYEIPRGMPATGTPNKATIKVYWCVVGLVAEWLGCTPEDLTVVVLAHELAHAYTQLGADIDGRRWGAQDFSKSETALKEGLAQYYTDRVLRRMVKRYPGALKAYEAMLPRQPEAYRTHLPWIAHVSPEAVRRAMLEVRRRGELTVAAFEDRLGNAVDDLV